MHSQKYQIILPSQVMLVHRLPEKSKILDQFGLCLIQTEEKGKGFVRNNYDIWMYCCTDFILQNTSLIKNGASVGLIYVKKEKVVILLRTAVGNKKNILY